ncbi:hypothetical protein LWI28_003041 [Acer negundo]|uniref:Uncharacterized protein n=1 Tax=Acer negundo TaxID=4023 RepID=A0AAD5J806_ACENE|nr:hypothetical protein LWI28_003041 [Acer negundo]
MSKAIEALANQVAQISKEDEVNQPLTVVRRHVKSPRYFCSPEPWNESAPVYTDEELKRLARAVVRPLEKRGGSYFFDEDKMIAACLFPPLTADRKRLAGAAPPSDESGDVGSKDDAPQYTLEDLAGGVPRYTPKEDLGHYEVGTNEAVALVDEAAAPTDEGPTPEDEETVRGLGKNLGHHLECGTCVLEIELVASPIEELEAAKDIGTIAMDVFEDLEEQGHRECRLMSERVVLEAFLVSMLASVSASLWVFKMLKLRSKRMVLWDLNHRLKQKK